MSEFLRKLEEILHYPDRLLRRIHPSATEDNTSSDPQNPSGKVSPTLPPSSHTANGATSLSDPPYRGVSKSDREYSRMDQPGEEHRQQRGSGSFGQSGQTQGQGAHGLQGTGDYYEPIEQVGGGSIAGGGGSRQARMRYSEEMGQEGQGMAIVPIHLSELVTTHPHHICNPTGGGEGFGGFQGAHPTKQSAGGDRDREGEQYGRRGPEAPREGSARFQELGTEDKRGTESLEPEFSKNRLGDIGLAAHRDYDGPHIYNMEGLGHREPGRVLLAHRVYSPAPKDIGGERPECTAHGPGDIGLAAHRDVCGPHFYEMEGVGRREEGRARSLRGYEGAGQNPGDVTSQSHTETTRNELGELGLEGINKQAQIEHSQEQAPAKD